MELVLRDEAIARGLTRYFTGKPCVRGHLSEMTVSGRVCVACAKARAAERRLADPDKLRAEAAAWYLGARDEIAARRREAYARDPEPALARARAVKLAPDYKANLERYRLINRASILAYGRRYAKGNRASRRINDQNRAARLRSVGGKLSPGLTQKLLKLQLGKCINCSCDLNVTGFHLDHIMPVALGGANVDSNIQLLCPRCNMKKQAKHPINWAQEQGRLL